MAIGNAIGIGFGASQSWSRYWAKKINDGLVGYWKLNELTGNAIDSLGVYNAVNVSVTQGVEGKIGKIGRAHV